MERRRFQVSTGPVTGAATAIARPACNTPALGPQRALTGPAARGDTAVVLRQGEAVAGWNALAGDAYRTMSVRALQLAQTGRTTSTGAKT